MPGPAVDFVVAVLIDGDQHTKDVRAPWGDRPHYGAGLFRDAFLITPEHTVALR